jgi:hypothetical protein
VTRFTGALPARQAFAKGWLMVMPSRAESFPYIVLETVAAAKPLLATRVGGVPEVMPDARLVPANVRRKSLQHASGRPCRTGRVNSARQTRLLAASETGCQQRTCPARSPVSIRRFSVNLTLTDVLNVHASWATTVACDLLCSVQMVPAGTRL